MIHLNPEEFAALPEPARRKLAAATLATVKTWLKLADLEQPEPVVDCRAEVIEIAKRARSLYLSPDTLLDLQEIARRCERWIAEAIKLGQRQRRIRDRGHRRGGTTTSPESVAKQHASGSLSAYYALFDDVSPECFEQALEIARRQGSLASAPLTAVIGDINGVIRPTIARRRAKIAELAVQNHTTRQIATITHLRPDIVSRIATQAGIRIPADSAVTNRSLKIKPERVVRETIITLEGLIMGLRLVNSEDYEDFDPDDVADWIETLNRVIPTINAMRKELTRVCDQNPR